MGEEEGLMFVSADGIKWFLLAVQVVFLLIINGKTSPMRLGKDEKGNKSLSLLSLLDEHVVVQREIDAATEDQFVVRLSMICIAPELYVLGPYVLEVEGRSRGEILQVKVSSSRFCFTLLENKDHIFEGSAIVMVDGSLAICSLGGHAVQNLVCGRHVDALGAVGWLFLLMASAGEFHTMCIICVTVRWFGMRLVRGGARVAGDGVVKWGRRRGGEGGVDADGWKKGSGGRKEGGYGWRTEWGWGRVVENVVWGAGRYVGGCGCGEDKCPSYVVVRVETQTSPGIGLSWCPRSQI
ncbi:hypothetical protein Tco_0556287 [Tanacetum coccineum]